jgi:heme/copper-type cytochrome/quinol oxidase subunit 4
MQEFFTNVSRYPRYLISFSLGVLYTLISPLLPLFKRPSTAIAAVTLLVAAFMFITFTLQAMLGLQAATN